MRLSCPERGHTPVTKRLENVEIQKIFIIFNILITAFILAMTCSSDTAPFYLLYSINEVAVAILSYKALARLFVSSVNQ